MSTRATIIVTYDAGNSIQLYHHSDGYPEYMGEMLASFMNAVSFISDSDKAMYDLLKAEKHFEFEKKGVRHTDIEYIWYVNMPDGTVSYTEMDNVFDSIVDIKDDDEYYDKWAKIFNELLNSKNGKIKYFKLK